MQIKITKKLVEWKERKVLSFISGEKKFHINPFVIYKKSWCIWWQIKKPNSRHTVIHQVNPLPRWKHKIQWRLELWFAKLKDKNAVCCQGCGEGVAKYEIIDPNEQNVNYRRLFQDSEFLNYDGSKTKVCEGCVSFYDRHFSRKPIRDNRKFHILY